MKILRDPKAFHVITTLDIYPSFDNRDFYIEKLRNLNMIEEIEELNSIGEEEFEELLFLYNKSNNEGLTQ